MAAARQDRIRVVLVDDNAALRAGLRALVESRDELAVVAETPRVPAALADIARKRPAIVVVGIDDGTGLDFLAQAHHLLGPASRLLVVTGSHDAALHYDTLCRGATGIVPKEQVPETLAAAILCLHAGRVWINAAIISDALAQVDRPPGPSADGLLTRRERQIARLVSRGLRNPRIAERLFLSEGTVRNHLTVIFRKLGVADRYGLIARWQAKS